jgi:FtsH-binding integral membrane protein
MYNSQVSSTTTYDMGLRQYFFDVYNYMTFALAVSGLISLGISMSPDLMKAIWTTWFKWVAVFLPLGMALAFSFMVEKIGVNAAKYFLIAFAAAMGLRISSILMIFKLGSIVNVFFITAATFGATSLYGYMTKRDLTKMGSFLMMGVIGLVIAGVINVFFQSSAISFAISCISVLVFTGLTAYETQLLKDTYYELSGDEREKAGVLGALNLYINFINIFLALLNILGAKKDE